MPSPARQLRGKAPQRRIVPFDLTLHASLGKVHLPFLRQNLAKAHAFLRPPLAELSVALVNDATMSELHQRFMDIAGPTDVLTFSLEADKKGRPLSGEVVICVPEARRQSKSHGVPIQSELLLYALHGMLHLCGFDDRTPSGYRAMHRTEDQLLTRLGIGPIFSPPLPRGKR